MARQDWSKYQVPEPKVQNPWEKYAISEPEPIIQEPEKPWYQRLFEPIAPEITSPAAQQHPYATELYNRFVRPISSIGGAAITGLGGPAIRAAQTFAPALLGAAGTGLGIYGGAKTIGKIGDISNEGFTPENVGGLLESGAMATALPFGVNMLKGNLGRIGARIASKDLPQKLPESWQKFAEPAGDVVINPNTGRPMKSAANDIGIPRTKDTPWPEVPSDKAALPEYIGIQKDINKQASEIAAGREAAKQQSKVIGPVYHGTRSEIKEFDTSKNSPWSYFRNMTKFTENPEYSELYSLGKTSQGQKRAGEIGPSDRPNTIAANIHAQNILDLTQPISSDKLKILQQMFPELKGNPSNEFILNNIQHSGKELPFDAIRYFEHGNINWAVPKRTKITTPAGLTLQGGKPKISAEEFSNWKNTGQVPQGLSPKGAQVIEEIAANPKKPVTPQEIRTIAGELPKIDIRRNPLNEAWNFGRTTLTSYDLSAPLRQGLGLAHRKEYWGAFDDMFKSLGKEDGFQLVQESITSDPEFNFIKDIGLKLTDLIDNREEAFLSSYAEKLPGVRASNRAYVAFLNKTRFDTTKSLINQAEGIGLEPKNNLVLAKAITEYVNTASGRGSLGKLEQSSTVLNNLLFSPRLISARLKMLNPNSYLQIGKGLSPQEASFIRKQYLKSLFDLAGSGRTLVELGRMAGGEVENDPRSSDFGKLKIGNTRLDPYGGFQQYIVAANRLASGSTKSSTTGNISTFGEHFGSPTRLSTLGRFAQSKAHPVIGFAMSMLEGKDFTGQPINVPASIAQMYIPMIIQDTWELWQDDPSLLPLLVPAGFGMGLQTYGGAR